MLDNSLEKFFLDNCCSLAIVSKANCISWIHVFFFLIHHHASYLLPVCNVWSTRTKCCLHWLFALKNKEPQRKWNPFSQWGLMHACTYKYWSLFQQGTKKTRSFLSILRIKLHAWAPLKPLPKQRTIGTVCFTALWRREDLNMQFSYPKTVKVTWSLEERGGDPILYASYRRKLSQKEKERHPGVYS